MTSKLKTLLWKKRVTSLKALCCKITSKNWQNRNFGKRNLTGCRTSWSWCAICVRNRMTLYIVCWQVLEFWFRRVKGSLGVFGVLQRLGGNFGFCRMYNLYIKENMEKKKKKVEKEKKNKKCINLRFIEIKQ